MNATGPLPEHEIENVKAGNGLAFEALYHKYKRNVYSLCLRTTKDAADAEDLTQEVFLQVYRRVNGLRNGAAFKSWLFRVTTNVILMHCRKRRILPVSLHYIFDDRTSAVVDVVETLVSPGFEPIERIALVRAIVGLPKCRRAVLVLHDIKGMSHREIATSLGVSLNTTKSNLSRAHDQLRGVLRATHRYRWPKHACDGSAGNNDGGQVDAKVGRLETGNDTAGCHQERSGRSLV